ncbi:hypothetical protein D9611_001226 [Ephemerocybe angulata]|uniref:DUF6534 domain-containing protein n=1 Tax=Ephemerocybe angulata TaxID=980116 RepID=A0A8H5FME9_9AGAR|nr:hypothetical protein D9611_001226 [Tulosesus angulatus]
MGVSATTPDNIRILLRDGAETLVSPGGWLGDGVDTPALIGPFFIGVILAYFLFGSYIVQLSASRTHIHLPLLISIPTNRNTAHYLNHTNSDPLWIQGLIAGVSAVELIGVVFITQCSWRILVLGPKSEKYIIVPSNTVPGIPLMNALAAALVQMFFAWRIYKLSSRYTLIVPFAIAALSFLQLSAAFAICGLLVQGHSHPDEYFKNTEIPIGIFLSASAACDILITLSLTISFLHFKSNTSLPSTHRLLNGLILSTVESGAVVTLCAVLNLAFFYGRSDRDAVHIVFQFIVGRLYSNVLLASLNGRRRRTAIAEVSGADSNGISMRDPAFNARPTGGDSSTLRDFHLSNNSSTNGTSAHSYSHSHSHLTTHGRSRLDHRETSRSTVYRMATSRGEVGDASSRGGEHQRWSLPCRRRRSRSREVSAKDEEGGEGEGEEGGGAPLVMVISRVTEVRRDPSNFWGKGWGGEGDGFRRAV